MNKRSETYMESHDMDWLFLINNQLIHCATNGAILPREYRRIKFLNSCKREIRGKRPFIAEDQIVYNERCIEQYVSRQMELYDILNNQNATNDEDLIEISRDRVRENYISSFKQMAIRGAKSYDYLEPVWENETIIAQKFILVAKPGVETPFNHENDREGQEKYGWWFDLANDSIMDEDTLLIYM